MAVMSNADLAFAETVATLAYSNPFLPQRIELERRALGQAFDERGATWNIDGDARLAQTNVDNLSARCLQLMDAVRRKLHSGQVCGDREALAYEDVVLFTFYLRYREGFDKTITEGRGGKPTRKRVTIYERFTQEVRQYITLDEKKASHLFALSFQIRRAFANIFNFILGRSGPAMKLRADVWQSVFTHDMRRYSRVLFDKMADYTTLITGPSGTGKELVAQAVGLSRYIPFDPQTLTFTADFGGTFYPLNLSAMSPTLIESELFGHTKGAFTGATGDRKGWLETCPPLGTVFLDEIGELDTAIQVKLLRVLQTRQFNRLGETQTRAFHGKLIAATNRDLAVELREQRFRTDLYYRLCSDIITTPSLRDRIADRPDELSMLIRHIAGRLVGPEADELAREVEQWIGEHLGGSYAWPGNVRELEQCVRNLLIRRAYQPAEADQVAASPLASFLRDIQNVQLTADDLLNCYCTLAYRCLGSYEAAATRLQLDRRTVKARILPELLPPEEPDPSDKVEEAGPSTADRG